jgi:hypothetical protein
MKNLFHDITIKYTRNQYLANEVTHQEYYSQFCGEFFINFIKENYGEKLNQLKSLDMSEIELSDWSGSAIAFMNHYRPSIDELFESAGDIVSQAGLVCLLKTAARIYLQKTKYFTEKEVHDLLDGAHSEFDMLKILYIFYFNAPNNEAHELKKLAFQVYKNEIEEIKKRLSQDKIETARIQALTFLEYTNKSVNRE